MTTEIKILLYHIDGGDIEGFLSTLCLFESDGDKAYIFPNYSVVSEKLVNAVIESPEFHREMIKTQHDERT